VIEEIEVQMKEIHIINYRLQDKETDSTGKPVSFAKAVTFAAVTRVVG
jgi:hypothetical protein